LLHFALKTCRNKYTLLNEVKNGVQHQSNQSNNENGKNFIHVKKK
jgi:hypothetical protein